MMRDDNLRLLSANVLDSNMDAKKTRSGQKKGESKTLLIKFLVDGRIVTRRKANRFSRDYLNYERVDYAY